METDTIGYLSIYQFASDVGYKTEEALQDLKDQGAQAIILDLRTNPGGILSEAVKVASNFIEDGTVVSVKSRKGEDEVYDTVSDIKAVNLPMVVLINEGSASASEIVAGAISDYDRGKLVGQRTFGKGTVQTVIPMGDGSALRLTTARYYTPDGTFIHEKGIEPDFMVEFDPEAEEDAQLQKAIELLKSEVRNQTLDKAS
jgi:carboxyl-terminal processing protease